MNVKILIVSILLLVGANKVSAQESRAPIDNPREPVASVAAAPMVTATATAKRVRFLSPGTVVQLRLEVFNETGQKLFDTELRGGNVLDWNLQDGAGERLPAGSYACVLTIKSLSGRISQRVGVVSVNDEKASIEAAGAGELSLAQQQAIGPIAGPIAGPVAGPAEGSAGFTVLQQSEAEAITTITHDGARGQVSRTLGPLSFRVGDVFSGKDKEQMRLTEDGRLGIGTSDPQAKLDVAGTIRAERVVIAKPGRPGAADKTPAADNAQAPDEQPLATGSGTVNRVAKWTETGGAGTLGDTQITESNGNLVVGNPSLTGNIQIYGTALQDVFSGMGPDVNVGPAFNYGYAGGTFGRSAGFFNVRPDASATPPNPSLRFMTSNVQRMIVTNTGDVGIGTSNPTAKLDVVGNINTSTQYNSRGLRVLFAPGGARVFVGDFAGASTVAGPGFGCCNSFFGTSAGFANTGGTANSFFGQGAGEANTMANYNSFFGAGAGSLNTIGGSNSFFGKSAGGNNTEGSNHSFFGMSAGAANTIGTDNSFFGMSAGAANTTGNHNAFFGKGAGELNMHGDDNSFFGYLAGSANSTGNKNSFFGKSAGENTTGGNNSFFGEQAGEGNTEGVNNTFIGRTAGNTNTTGNSNTVLGFGADVGSGDLVFATAIGAGAMVTASSTVVLGRAADTVSVPGTLSKAAGSFKIDHPLDPANKYLSHSFVESPDMMNVYNGNTTTDARGLAVIILPEYFEALNRDFRYQLTVIGQFAQAIVLKRIEGNRFQIKTSKPRVDVSWQVTGVRQDAYANARRIPTEELKPEAERGTYLHPDAFEAKITAAAATSNGGRTAYAKRTRLRR